MQLIITIGGYICICGQPSNPVSKGVNLSGEFWVNGRDIVVAAAKYSVIKLKLTVAPAL